MGKEGFQDSVMPAGKKSDEEAWKKDGGLDFGDASLRLIVGPIIVIIMK